MVASLFGKTEGGGVAKLAFGVWPVAHPLNASRLVLIAKAAKIGFNLNM
ncbi:MAG: hypothetical protein ACK569_04375 [Hyphomonadaceae bacterium]|jgi:hypothetical protein